MPSLPKTKNAIERLNHVNGYLQLIAKDENVAEWTRMLKNRNLDLNWSALIAGFYECCMARALSEWYPSGDVNRVKTLFYNMGKLRYIGLLEKWVDISYRRYTYTNILYCMPIFISDHPGLIKWCTESNFGLADSKNKDKIHLYEYFIKNIFLAMRKQWDELEARCRSYIANPRPRPYSRMDIFEFQFMLALATGDIPKMEAVLSEFVTPRGIRTNSASETGFTDGLISTVGLLFAKLAWQNGYEININSPYIPQEWLPVQPLDHYEDEFDFMKAYTIDPTKGATSV